MTQKHTYTKTITGILTLILVLFVMSCNNQLDEKPIKNDEKLMTKQLRHVVLFKFKEATSKEVIKTIETAFAELPNKIKEIKGFEWGLNNSPEGLDKGFTHCFFVTFESDEARSIYLPHPDHQDFVDLISPHIEDVLVLDYWAK